MARVVPVLVQVPAQAPVVGRRSLMQRRHQATAPKPAECRSDRGCSALLLGGLTAAATVCAHKQVKSRTEGRPSRTATPALGGWPNDFVTSGDAQELLQKVQWPAEWPYTPDDFRRQDEMDDTVFYSAPRFCTHVDDNFVQTLTQFYEQVFKDYKDPRILDICSSWISHYPEEKCWSHVSITGMNDAELKANRQADDYALRNLNVDPTLPYKDASFDIVTCTVSMDYLNKPLEVMKEVGRVLKPGGTVILSTSNRCFPTKAVDIWLRTEDMGHVLIYGSYIHYTGQFERPEALDLTPPLGRLGFCDPVYVVIGKRL
eukprot:2759089-Amphidinium_carterae.1